MIASYGAPLFDCSELPAHGSCVCSSMGLVLVARNLKAGNLPKTQPVLTISKPEKSIVNCNDSSLARAESFQSSL